MLRKIKYRIKWLLNDLLSLFGQGYGFSAFKGEVRTLVFHGICADEDTPVNARFLRHSQFIRLLEELGKEANILSLEEYVKAEFDPQKLNVLITFDDGYANNRSMALPVCEKLGIPFTIFITNRSNQALWTDLLDIQQERYPTRHQRISELVEGYTRMSNQQLKQQIGTMSPEKIELLTIALQEDIGEQKLRETGIHWQLLSDEDLRFLAEHPLVSLANHSANHYHFCLLTESQQIEELNAVRQRLEGLNSAYPNVFAYPFGNYDEQTIDVLKRAGITHQFCADGTQKSLSGCDDRLTVNPYISIHNQLRALAHGRY